MKLIYKFFKSLVATPGDRMEIDDIFSPILFGQTFFGEQILNPDWSWSSHVPFLISAVAIMVYVTIGTLDVMSKSSDINVIAEAVVTLLLILSATLKFSMFVRNRFAFREAYVSAKTTLFNGIKEVSPDKAARVLKLLKAMVALFYFFEMGAICNYWLDCLWRSRHGTRMTLSRTTSTLMPMTSPYYEIAFAIHTFFLSGTGFTILMTDAWFACLVYVLCEACECSTELLKVKKMVNESSESYKTRLNDSLRRFYKFHVQLMEYLNVLREIYKWPVIVPMFTVLSVTCLFLLITTVTQTINFQMGFLMIPGVFEISAYCWFGERVKTKISEINMALFLFDWASLRLAEQKSYYIIMCYMNKEFGIKSAIGVELSLLSLTTIYKTSYQVFAVMNSMEN